MVVVVVVIVVVLEKGHLKHIRLQQHEAARTTDSDLLDFLNHVRQHQPSRACLRNCFQERQMSHSKTSAVRKSIEIEAATHHVDCLVDPRVSPRELSRANNRRSTTVKT